MPIFETNNARYILRIAPTVCGASTLTLMCAGMVCDTDDYGEKMAPTSVGRDFHVYLKVAVSAANNCAERAVRLREARPSLWPLLGVDRRRHRVVERGARLAALQVAHRPVGVHQMLLVAREAGVEARGVQVAREAELAAEAAAEAAIDAAAEAADGVAEMLARAPR